MINDNYEFGRYIPTESDTRWADKEEIQKADTVLKINIETEDCPKGGIPLISDGKIAYIDNSDTHTIIFGSTGSKKTRLFGMPLINILALSGESFITTDPKGELYEKTSGLVAAKGYDLHVLNFRDLIYSDFWNPLALPYELYHDGKQEEAVSLINDLVTALAEPQRASAQDLYWIEMATAQALANLLFFIDTATPQEANMFNFASFFLKNCSVAGTQKVAEMVAKNSIADINYQSVLANAPAEKTFGCVTSCVSVMLNPFILRKTLSRVLSKSSFNIRDIGKKKTAIYIIVPDEKTTLHFLVTMFIKQTYETMISEAQMQNKRKLPVRVNFVLDEFANIPMIPDMASMISAARSRNMRFFLMIQGMIQLEKKYEKDAHTIKGNCDNWIFLSSREHALIEEISVLCGIKSNSERLITIPQLQQLKKEWEYSEALIRHARNYPLVSSLPDIDEYKFKKHDPIPFREQELPTYELYDVDKVIDRIKKGDRPIPFSLEVTGKEAYYTEESSKAKTDNDTLWDW
jgi:type IV secretion system protein VirD4